MINKGVEKNMKQSKNIVFFLLTIILAVIMLASIFAPKRIINVNASQYNCTAKSMCVIEQSSGRVLLEKNKDDRLAMASTTKIMTALVALENCTNLDEQFDVDNRAVGIEGTSIYLKKDEKLSMRELLYGLMLNSGNDSAMAIGYKIGNGDITKFVDLMNQKASDLGLSNTHFDNPHGLDSATHYTSSYDLALITSKAMENKDFRDIVKTDIREISCPKQMGHRFVRNKHKLLKTMDGCEGVKTGFTDNALRCCVTSCYRNNMRLICVVLNCNDMFLESQKALEKCFDEYSMTSLVEPYKFVDRVLVNNGTIDKVKLYIKNGLSYPLSSQEIDKIKIQTNYKQNVDAPIKKDTKVGEIRAYLNDKLIYVEDIYTMEDVKQKDTIDKMKDIFDQWYLE